MSGTRPAGLSRVSSASLDATSAASIGWNRKPTGAGITGNFAICCATVRITSWEALLKKYERLVFSIPLNYGLSRADAADLSQVTFTILIQGLDSLDDDSRLGAWLSTAARRHTWRLVERRHEGTGKG
jgi:hypothetical protein